MRLSSSIKLLFKNLSLKLKVKLFFIFTIIIINSFTEIVTIGSVIPLITILIDPSYLTNLPYVNEILNFFNIKDQNVSIFILISFISLIFFSAFINIIFITINVNFSKETAKFLTKKIFSNYLAQTYENSISRHTSKYYSAIIEKTNGVLLIVQSLVLGLSNAFILLIIFLMILIYDQNNSILIVIFFGLLYFFLSIFLKKYVKKLSKDVTQFTSNRSKFLSEAFKILRIIILNKNENLFKNLFKKAEDNYRSAESKILIFSQIPKFILESIGIITLVIIAMYLKNSDFNNDNILFYLAVIAFAAQRSLPRINQIFTSWFNIRSMENNLNDVNELSKVKVKKQNSKQTIKFKNKIELKNLFFKYTSNKKSVLKNINFTVKKGEKIFIFGKSGSGKSTFLDIILGLLIPNRGTIKVDNRNVTKIGIYNFRNLISSVSQANFLLDDTIKNNITLNRSINYQENSKLKSACKHAEIYEFIDNLDKKLDTNLGESGFKISGGQRQRIAIARSLFKKHQILIFDEATNSLDSKIEKKIIENLINVSDLTFICVSHNNKLSNLFDKTYKFSNGNIKLLK